MKRNKFNLSHYRLLTMDMGYLVPLTWYEVLPGDTVQHGSAALIRVSPLLSPVMHPVRVRIHHWFVPFRLIWDSWEDFITGGPDGRDASVVPTITINEVLEGSLHDYLGVPTGSFAAGLKLSAFPYRAYARIFNDFYRDQDLVAEAAVETGDGNDATVNKNLLRASWEKDYFTTARPWEQKGTEVTIPVGDLAPVKGFGVTSTTYTGPGTYKETGGVTRQYLTASGMTNFAVEEDTAQGNTGFPGVYADLSKSTGVSVNDLRLALAIQRYQEARAQYGSRYVEYLRYLGVRSSDARLQNPEYLGGGKQVIQFSEVLQTADTQNGVVGDLKGHGISAMKTARYRRFFEEHGLVMTLMSVIPKSIYTTTLHKKWHRTIKEEYFQKELQFLGDQEVKNVEIQANHTTPDGTFGYQTRYDDYRWIPSGVSGEFRSISDHWHYARDFAGDVALNSSFIQSVPTKRVYASTDTHCLQVMSNHKVIARRMMQKHPHARTF